MIPPLNVRDVLRIVPADAVTLLSTGSGDLTPLVSIDGKGTAIPTPPFSLEQVRRSVLGQKTTAHTEPGSDGDDVATLMIPTPALSEDRDGIVREKIDGVVIVQRPGVVPFEEEETAALESLIRELSMRPPPPEDEIF